MDFIVGYGLFVVLAPTALAVGLAINIFARELWPEERYWHRNEYHSSADLPPDKSD